MAFPYKGFLFFRVLSCVTCNYIIVSNCHWNCSSGHSFALFISHSMPFLFFFRSSRSFLVRCIFAMHSLWRRKTCKFTSTKNVLWFLSCLFMKEKWKKKKTKFKLVLNYLRGFSMLISCFFLLCCSLSDSFTVQ